MKVAFVSISEALTVKERPVLTPDVPQAVSCTPALSYFFHEKENLVSAALSENASPFCHTFTLSVVLP